MTAPKPKARAGVDQTRKHAQTTTKDEKGWHVACTVCTWGSRKAFRVRKEARAEFFTNHPTTKQEEPNV